MHIKYIFFYNFFFCLYIYLLFFVLLALFQPLLTFLTTIFSNLINLVEINFFFLLPQALNFRLLYLPIDLTHHLCLIYSPLLHFLFPSLVLLIFFYFFHFRFQMIILKNCLTMRKIYYVSHCNYY